MGISFAIPIDEAIRVSEQLRATGRVQRGRLGVQIDQVSKEVAESLGLSKPQGALVRGVEQGSPAEKAGLEAGDIILRFDGKLIEKSADLPRQVGNTKPGTVSKLQIWRRGSSKELSITVGEFEPEKPAKKAAAPAEKPATSQAAKFLGLTLSDLTDAQKKELKLRGGVRVDAAAEAAARAGIQEGDVILALANTETPTVQVLEGLVSKLDRTKPVSVLVRRGEWAQYTVIRPAAK
jgi:serine protease Do